MKKILIFIIIFASLFAFFVPKVAAQATCDSSTVGACINNRVCTCTTGGAYCFLGSACGSAIIGKVYAPQGVRDYNVGNGNGLIAFASVLIRVINIVAGSWVIFHFVYAGWIQITMMGDNKAYTDMKDRLTFAFIGLIIMAGSYSMAGIIGYAFYGDPTFILNPKLESAIQVTPPVTP